MKKLKIISVFGTRPEAIKMCPLLKEMEKREEIQSIICVTGQHREMLQHVLDIFGIVPDYDLKLMKDNQSVTDITTGVLTMLEPILNKERPDMVLVHGDTTSSVSAALAAFYQRIPVGHVEAGLRTYDNESPYPEEMNRRIIDQIAELQFAPTEGNLENLRTERHADRPRAVAVCTGNTAIDAFVYTVKDGYRFKNPVLREVFERENGRKTILLTVHRRENQGEPLEDICKAVKQILSERDDLQIICPVHPNPKVKAAVNEKLNSVNNLYLTDPLDVDDLHNLLKKCYLILTDSGGLQEEGPYFGIPVIVLRKETERPEAVLAGTVKVVGTKQDTIVKATRELLEDAASYDKMAKALNPYGDGHASERICDEIMEYFK